MLPESSIKEYWRKRSEAQGALTVGYGGHNASQQAQEYTKKISFVRPFLNPALKTLDYGCGVGRWSHLFPSYLGVDITENLLHIARRENPTKNFQLLENPFLISLLELNGGKFEQFFTSTVLQHCALKVVQKLFYNLSQHYSAPFTMVLYENSKVQSQHVQGRSPLEYKDLIANFFTTGAFQQASHVVHGEEHGVLKIRAEAPK